MKRASWKKWAWIVSGTALALLVAFVCFVFSQLPSKRELTRALTESEAPTTVAAAAPQPSGSPSTGAVAADPAAPQTGPAEALAKAEEKRRQARMLVMLTEEDRRDNRVCSQLGQSKLDLTKKDLSFEEAFSEDRTDSIKEAFRIPMREIFQEPHLTALLQEVIEIDPQFEGKSDSEREGFFEKIGFYSRVAATGAALYANRQKYEDLGDRATHLSKLAELVVRKPELKDSTAIQDYCRAIESPETVPDRAGLVAERRKLLDLIAQAGLNPADLNFDPDDWIRFKVDAGKNGLNISLKGKSLEDGKSPEAAN